MAKKNLNNARFSPIREKKKALLNARLIPDISNGILPEDRRAELEACHSRRKVAESAYRFSYNLATPERFVVSAACGAVESIRKGGKRPYQDPEWIPQEKLEKFYETFDKERDWALYFAFLDLLKERGFFVIEDRDVKSRYKSIAKYYHQGGKGGLRFRSNVYPAGMSFEFYQDHTGDHPSGPRYECNKWSSLSPESKILLKATIKSLGQKALSLGLKDYTEPALKTPFEKLYWAKLNCWHWKKVPLHMPQKTEIYNDKDADGVRLVNGDLRYYRHWDGRLYRGLVFHNLNNMWWVISSGEIRNLASFELFSLTNQERSEPGGRVISKKSARRRIERELEHALKEENFERAVILRDIRNKIAEKRSR